MIKALIFDIDGTLAETEEGHRAAFNAAFAEAGLDWTWDVDLYRELYRITGGKERMHRYAEMRGVSSAELSDADIARLHARKNAHYAEIVQAGLCPLRPGVERLIRKARARGLRLAVCSTTSRINIDALVEATLRPEGLSLFDSVVSGEDAPIKKPAPDAYLLALEQLALRPEDCLAFEDSRNGLISARAAGLAAVVTPSLYTSHETFDGAAIVLPDLSGFELTADGFAAEPTPA